MLISKTHPCCVSNPSFKIISFAASKVTLSVLLTVTVPDVVIELEALVNEGREFVLEYTISLPSQNLTSKLIVLPTEDMFLM